MSDAAWRWLGLAGSLYAATSAMAETPDERLYEAVCRGEAAEIRASIDAGARVREHGAGLLAVAVGRDRMDGAEVLLSAGADVNQEVVGGGTPLSVAVANRNAPVSFLDRLLAAGAELRAGAEREGLLQTAVRSGRYEAARWLLAHGVLLSTAASAQVETSELMLLAGHDVLDEAPLVEMSSALLKANADTSWRDRSGRTAADLAAEKGYADFLAVLEPGNPMGRDLKAIRQEGLNRKLGLALSMHHMSRINWAKPPPEAAVNQEAAIRRLLREGADPNAVVPFWRGKRSLLEIAIGAREEHVPTPDPLVLSAMMEAGAKWTSMGDREGEAMARVAASPDALRLALDHGVRLTQAVTANCMDQQMKPIVVTTTLLHASAEAGSEDCVRLLLKRGANLEAKDSLGFSPLMAAVAAGKEGATRLLLAGGARIDCTSNDGRSLADLAAAAGNLVRVRSWDSSGKYRELLAMYPPITGSRWCGEWISGASTQETVTQLAPDGGGSFLGSPIAWREVGGGVLIRLVQQHPKIRGATNVGELSFTPDREGGLRFRHDGGGERVVPAWYTLRRRGVPAPSPEAYADAQEAEQLRQSIRLCLEGLRTGQRAHFDFNGQGKGLIPFPPEILATQGLKSISINSPQLQNLPASLASQQSLEQLTVSAALHLKVEDGALDLPHVKRMEIAYCRLPLLPLRLEKLSALTELLLSNNRLETLPAGWRQATSLRTVYAFQNHLRRLPDDLGDAPALEVLNVGGNVLMDLPSSLARAPLFRLGLSDNRFVEVPQVILSCARLRDLSLERNRISVVPPQLFQLPELVGLDLSANCLTTFPTMVAGHLRSLNLSRNRIAQWPGRAEAIPKNIVSLDLSGNQLREIPAWLEQCAFERLDLDGNPLPPEVIERVQRITRENFRRQATKH